MWKDNRDGLLHWSKRYYKLWTRILAKSNCVLKLKCLDWFVFTNTQLLASQGINWWTGVVWITCGLLWCFYQLFGLSFWRHPFTTEDALVKNWYNAKLLQVCCHEESNSSTSWLAWGGVNFQQIIILVWTIPLSSSAQHKTFFLHLLY